MSVAKEIRQLKMKKSAELRAREARAAKRSAGRFEKHLQNYRAPGSMHDPGFLAQLDRKAREAKDRAGEAPRPDLDKAIATAREKGHLPAAHTGGTSYVPTAEEILGDATEQRLPARINGATEALPSADDVLNSPSASGDGAPVAGSSFTREELDEIARMNPPRGRARPQKRH